MSLIHVSVYKTNTLIEIINKIQINHIIKKEVRYCAVHPSILKGCDNTHIAPKTL